MTTEYEEPEDWIADAIRVGKALRNEINGAQITLENLRHEINVGQQTIARLRERTLSGDQPT